MKLTSNERYLLKLMLQQLLRVDGVTDCQRETLTDMMSRGLVSYQWRQNTCYFSITESGIEAVS